MAITKRSESSMQGNAKADEIKNLLMDFNREKFNGQLVIKMHGGEISLVECTAKGNTDKQIRKLPEQIRKVDKINKKTLDKGIE